MITVYCQHIERFPIERPDSANLKSGEIHLLPFGVSENAHSIPIFAQMLNDMETVRAASYRLEKDRNRFIISRGLLRRILGNYLRVAPDVLDLPIDKNYKPHPISIGGIQIHYSMSHAGDMIFIGIAGHSIGVDIEYIDRKFEFHDVLTAAFSEAEILSITQSSDSLKTFFQLWVRKEALLKGTGKGIDDEIISTPSLDGKHIISSALLDTSSNWEITDFNIGADYHACIADSVSGSNVTVFRGSTWG